MGRAGASVEQIALRRSILASVVLSVLAVGWGLVANSQVILLDGAYMVIGVVLTALSLTASRLMAAGPTTRFPFGLEALAPLAVGVQGMALLAVSGYAAAEAVRLLVHGGTDVAAGSVAGYALLSGLAALGLHRYVRSADPSSDLLNAEARQWWAGALLSLVVCLGALAALLMRAVGWTAVERYVDPVLVLVACLMLVPQPIAMLRTMVRELLEGAPAPEVQEPVRRAVAEVRAEYDLAEPTLRMTKVGRKLYVEAGFLVPAGRWDVADEDRVRRALSARLDSVPFDVWLNLELTTDPRLIA